MYADDKLTDLIHNGESDRVEFTASVKDMDKVREAICAFANDLHNHQEPGFVFVGIKDNKDCADLNIDDKLLLTLSQLRDDGKIQPLPSMAVDKRKLDGCELVVIQVEVSDNPPFKVDGRCWIRIGSRRGQATSEDERRLIEKRRWYNLPHDMQGVKGASVEHDLDMQKFELEYLPAAVSPEVLEKNDRSREEQLQALRLTTQAGIPTVTALLVLGEEPRRWFPSAYIQFVRYGGGDYADPILDQKEIHGTLPEQVRDLDTILRVNISAALDTSGNTHIQKPDYPIVALRELAHNAIIHRNYNGSHTPVRVSWFTDRVEIISPGSVYGTVTRDNFGEPGRTAYRNPTLAEAMKNLGFMQKFGMGIYTARQALRDNGNPEVEFNIQETLIIVTVRQRQ